jgi:DNA processing protein
MTDNELFHLLALVKIEGVGNIMAKKLINHCGSAEKVFQAKPSILKNIDGVGKVLIENLFIDNS